MEPSRSFQDEVILLTGASGGIGRELAVVLAERGARLVLGARSEAGLAETARRCESSGATVAVVAADVSNPDDCRLLVERAVERFGALDVLVNNAGILSRSRFEETSDLTVFERVMQVNYLGAVHTTFHALPHLKARRGLLVAISSFQGKTGFPTYSAYVASKFAMQGFFDSLRIELYGSGVDVLVVSPGAVATEMHLRPYGPSGAPIEEHPPGMQFVPSARQCAEQIAAAMERRDRELILAPRGKLLLWLKLLAPRRVDDLVSDLVRSFHGR